VPLERVDEAIDLAEAALPAMTPTDICLVSSPALLDEIERKLELPRLRKHLRASDTPALVRRQVASVSAVMVPEFPIEDVPEYAEGRDGTTTTSSIPRCSGGALAIVSDDVKHIALTADEPKIYGGDAGVIPAYQFDPFVDSEIGPSSLDRTRPA
jgi:hypothetical protein